MYCVNCGANTKDGARFCHNCGTLLTGTVKSPQLIQLVCKQCQGTMQAKDDEQVLICPFCGSIEKIVENDEVVIEKIRHQTVKEYKEVELSRQKFLNSDRNKDMLEKAVKAAARNPALSLGIGFAVVSLIITSIRPLLILGIILICVGVSRDRR